MPGPAGDDGAATTLPSGSSISLRATTACCTTRYAQDGAGSLVADITRAVAAPWAP
ncbi:hypothetical protein ACQP1P_35185 [Dactylosporangium sp. CA-052675]|uniref:hypothetical protein n=1 Tax=Dactylosporangium sp. CA-052675 TaxID=3239927 RepID=UPI003D948EB0